MLAYATVAVALCAAKADAQATYTEGAVAEVLSRELDERGEKWLSHEKSEYIASFGAEAVPEIIELFRGAKSDSSLYILSSALGKLKNPAAVQRLVDTLSPNVPTRQASVGLGLIDRSGFAVAREFCEAVLVNECFPDVDRLHAALCLYRFDSDRLRRLVESTLVNEGFAAAVISNDADVSLYVAVLFKSQSPAAQKLLIPLLRPLRQYGPAYNWLSRTARIESPSPELVEAIFQILERRGEFVETRMLAADVLWIYDPKVADHDRVARDVIHIYDDEDYKNALYPGSETLMELKKLYDRAKSQLQQN